MNLEGLIIYTTLLFTTESMNFVVKGSQHSIKCLSLRYELNFPFKLLGYHTSRLKSFVPMTEYLRKRGGYDLFGQSLPYYN